MNNNNNNQNIYDNFYTYDEPIPYITESSKKVKENIEQQINDLQLIQSDIDEQTQLKLDELKKEFEKHILYIYPVRMNNYRRFYTSVNCIMIEKNKIPDAKVISMAYLDFLFHLMKDDTNGIYYSFLLCDLLNLCCGVEIENIKYIRDENYKINLVLGLKQEDGNFIDITVNKKDFDEIKNIILHQNIPTYDDTYIDPKVEKALKEAEEFMNRHKKKMGSLEDQIICVLISTNLNMEQIKNLTIRKFVKILQRVDYKLHYEIYKTASMSGFVSFKEDIDHWMSEISKEKYSDTVLDYGQFKGKMKNAVK